MKVLESQKHKKSFLLRLAVFAFAAYLLVALVNQQIKIQNKRRELEAAKQQIQIQEIKNEDLKHAFSTGANDESGYIERKAREELNYAKPGERVFVNIAGH
ncbi:MAG: septum formation initiator family protein [Oscillospiraceae bacterium]|jgi:cell division protein DivIC|nr:septum formation initiator family protein [Oscillospiraceae bacterium]